MANSVSNRLMIEGEHARQVLLAAGFLQVLDDDRAEAWIVTIKPDQATVDSWPKGHTEWPEGYPLATLGSRLLEDLWELTDNRVRLRFYTRWSPAFGTLENLAAKFPSHRFEMRSVDISGYSSDVITAQDEGETFINWRFVFEGGQCILNEDYTNTTEGGIRMPAGE